MSDQKTDEVLNQSIIPAMFARVATGGATPQEAMDLAQTAKERLPDSPFVMDTLGWVYFKKGFYDLALVEVVDSLEKAVESVSEGDAEDPVGEDHAPSAEGHLGTAAAG